MTLVITVVTNYGLWQSSDHKLVAGTNEIPDPSVKHVYLEAQGDKALIAYAGIGRVKNTHISEWVRNVLRGPPRTLLDCLWMLCEAANKNLLPISKQINVPHTFSIAAYKDGVPILYFISNRVWKKNTKVNLVGGAFKFWSVPLEGPKQRIIINLEGQGALATLESEARELIERTIRRRSQKPKIGRDVMGVLARLNADASVHPLSEGTVSENCLVTYLAGPKAGAESRFYGPDNLAKDLRTQHIANGFDVNLLVDALIPVIRPRQIRELEAIQKGEKFVSTESEQEIAEVNERIRKIYKDPSDKFG